MKTAMQIVIDEITKLKEIDLELFKILTPILSRGEDKEKQDIIDAYADGLNQTHGHRIGSGLDYYTSTFETNKETLK